MKTKWMMVSASVALLGGVAVWAWQPATDPGSSQHTAAASSKSTAYPPAIASDERPTASLRLSDSQERPFIVVFNDFKARANIGDPEAQRELSDIYGRCLIMGASSSSYLQGIEMMAAMKSNRVEANRLLAAARQFAAECEEVGGGQLIPIEAHKLWLQQAAKSGDLPAKVRMSMYYPAEATQYPIPELLEQALAEADSLALFDLGQVLGRGQVDLSQTYGSALSGDYGAYALSIVACQRGLDCGGDSSVMRSACLNTTGCGNVSYEDFVRNYMVPAGDMEILNQRVASVARLIPRKD